MERYRHFIFDIDGTLIDTEKTGVLSLIDTIKQLMDRDISYDEAYKFFGIPSFRVGSILEYPEPENFGDVWEENFIRLSDLIRPFDRVEEVLSAIKNSGRTIGCVTSRSLFEFNKDPHLNRLVHFFDHTVCAEDSIRHKPFPDPMFAYMKKAEVASGVRTEPSECIYIGDTMHDWQCGHAAGCDFALADWMGRGMQGIPAEYHLGRTEDILELLQY